MPTTPASPLSSLLARSVAAEKTKRQPTEEQRAVIDAAKAMNGRGVLVIEAGAGAGKTTTLTMLEEVLSGVGQYTAFNASLVADSKKKFKRVACTTTHGLGFRAEGKRFAHRLDGNRVKSEEVARRLGISDYTVPQEGVDKDGNPNRKVLSAGFLAGQVLGAVRRYCQSADAQPEVKHFKYIDGIDAPLDGHKTYANNDLVKDHLVPFARAAWEDMSDPEGTLPYNHDCYVKVWERNRPVIAADYILLDEDQDTAEVMVSVLRQQRDCLIILVGDSAQTIYSWRGTVDAVKAFPDAPRRQLSQSFRFGPAVADVANSVLDTLQEKTSLRIKGLPSIDSRVERLEKPACVLCRTNACALSTMLNAIGAGKRVHLIGKQDEVISFVNGAKDLQAGQRTNNAELACFEDWAEVVLYSKLDEGEDLRLMVKLVEEFGCDAILGALKGMPKEDAADLVISTAHKSKGREWDTVKIAPDFPTVTKSSDEDKRLMYVAVTRAKTGLDITECPFFTGQDACQIVKRTTAAQPTEGAECKACSGLGHFDVDGYHTTDPNARKCVDCNGSGRLPVSARHPARPAPTTFSWSKDREGNWLVRGPKGATGTVEVVSRDGRRAKKTIRGVVREFEDACLYRV